ncbi:hypothetical protein JOF55_004859 [Haloactinomyces albus]|uniref:Uncharacterized protein n=2 Tax=Haloactinomyces albus TaxID=1352928 RepID=A0AAE4CNN0_9ACTN|nr:hypothetical protein [Haloactinomyces albus]
MVSDNDTVLGESTDAFKALGDPVRMDLFLRIATVDEVSCTDRGLKNNRGGLNVIAGHQAGSASVGDWSRARLRSYDQL